MFSRHPLDQLREKIDAAGVADALRLAIMAELDAISLYQQLATRIGDEGVRRVFLDVAREEKAHVGEFLELLKRVDPEQARELAEGAREAAELVGQSGGGVSSSAAGGDPPGGGGGVEDVVGKFFRESVAGARLLLRVLPTVSLGLGVDAVVVEHIRESAEGVLGVEEEVVGLREVAVEFTVPRAVFERAQRLGVEPDLAAVAAAARRLAAGEEKTVIDTLLSSAGHSLEAAEWGQPGAVVDVVAEAIARMEEAGVGEPYALILHPTLYTALLAVHERTGVTELHRVEKLARVYRNPLLPRGTAVLVSLDPAGLDVVLGADAELEYAGLERGVHRFRGFTTLAVRVKNPGAIAVLRAK